MLPVLPTQLQTAEERSAYIDTYFKEHPSERFTSKELNYISDYILMINQKDQTKKEKHTAAPILTNNRESTVNKREQSLEEIVAGLENGEDGLYALINIDKNQKLDHRDRITEKEIEEIPGLKEQYDLLEIFSRQLQTATGNKRYQLKKAIIETWQQMYIIRRSYKNPIAKGKPSNTLKAFAHMDLDEIITLAADGTPVSSAPLNLLNPTHISFLLSNYVQLKEEVWDDLQNDMHFLLLDLEQLIEDTFAAAYPKFYDIIIWKIDGCSAREIQDKVYTKYKENHSETYYSNLWRQRIPKMIAKEAQKQYLIWYYTNIEKGQWKTCTKCGETKPAHPLFFSRNSNKAGWYSQCKDCRNKKE